MKLILRNNVSDILRITSFVAALCVVATHSNVDKRWNFVFGTLTCWAVPYFFMASGFFFATSSYVSDPMGGGGAQFYAKKVKGLLLPYILWCLIACLVGTPLVMLNNYMSGHPLLERTTFESHSLWGSLDAMFGICRDSPKALGVLWFLRALIILFLFAPLWRFLSHASLAWIFVPLFCGLFFFVPRLSIGGLELCVGTPSFFFLGIAVAKYLPRKWLFTTVSEGGRHLISKSFSSICMLSFWIYVTHNLFMSYLIAIGRTLSRQSLLPVTFIAPLSFLIAATCSIASGGLVRHCFPSAFSVLNGAR